MDRRTFVRNGLAVLAAGSVVPALPRSAHAHLTDRPAQEEGLDDGLVDVPDHVLPDVLIVDGVSLAISVHYDPEFMIAPVVLDVCGNLSYDSALGSARAGRVPICEDTPLARALEVSTPRGTFIPANLYWAVAKVLARVYRVHSRQLPLFPHERG